MKKYLLRSNWNLVPNQIEKYFSTLEQLEKFCKDNGYIYEIFKEDSKYYYCFCY